MTNILYSLYQLCGRMGFRLAIPAVALMIVFSGWDKYQTRFAQTDSYSGNLSAALVNTPYRELKTWRQDLRSTFYERKVECGKRGMYKSAEINSGIPAKRSANRALTMDSIQAFFLFLFLMSVLALTEGKEEGEKENRVWLHMRLWCLFAATLLDLLENLGTRAAINGDPGFFAFNFFLICSYLKSFAWILFTVLNAPIIYRYLGRFFSVLYENLLQTIILLLLYGVFFVSDQGQNLLINLNKNSWAVFWFLLILSFFAAMNWHISKFFQNKALVSSKDKIRWRDLIYKYNWNVDESGEQSGVYKYHKYVPRMFGVMIFLIPACALVHVHFIANPSSTFARFTNANQWILFFGFGFFLLFNSEVLVWVVNRIRQIGVNSLCVVGIGAMVFSGLLNDGSQWSLKFLSISLFILAAYFALVTSTRNVIFTKSKKQLRFLGLDLSGGKVNAPLSFSALGLVILMIYFILRNCFSTAYHGSFLFPVLAVIFVAYEIIIAALLIIQWRIKFKILVVFVLTFVVITQLVDNKTYYLRVGSPRQVEAEIPEINSYVDAWLNARKNDIEKTEGEYHIYLVNGYGGGIRASAYFYYVMHELNDTFIKKHGRSIFPQVFSMSTASGSSLGAACLVADLSNPALGKPRSVDAFDTLIQNDYLSPVLIGMIGGDMLSRFSAALPDRDELQDLTWEHHLPYMSTNYYDIYARDTGKKIPALLCNISESQISQSVLLAPFRFNPEQLSGRKDAADLMGHNRINLSTAALLTARFPLISPAALTNGHDYFHDGGLTENSGARSSLEMYRAIEKRIRQRLEDDPENNAWLKKLRFVFISIDNVMAKEETPKAEMTQLQSLFHILLGTGVNGNSERSVQELRAMAQSDKEEVSMLELQVNNDCLLLPRPKFWEDAIKRPLYVQAILPLGWQLSATATAKLHSSAVTEVGKVVGRM